MSWKGTTLNEKAEQILRDHLIDGVPVADVALAHSVTPSYIYHIMHSPVGFKWMLDHVNPSQSSLNLKVAAALNKRLDRNIDGISTADLIKILVATTPKEVSSAVYESVRDQAETMANENGLEGHMRERFIATVLEGVRAA